jgi:hypothetical protein
MIILDQPPLLVPLERPSIIRPGEEVKAAVPFGMFLGGAKDPYFANVELLLHGNGSHGSTVILDSSKNGFTPSAIGGNASISTAQSRWGGSSIYFDGTGDYIAYNTLLPALGTADLTIEFWFMTTTTSKQQAIIDTKQVDGDSEPRVDFDNTFNGGANDGVLFFAGNAGRATSSALSANTWYHVAVTRTSNVWRLFVGGVQAGSNYTLATNMTRRRISLGCYTDVQNTSSTNKFQGYLDDLRVTMGVSRYTTTFAVPTAPFPDQ